MTLFIDSNSLIDIYNTGFIVCLAFAILFFVAAVVLFFVFDIRYIFNIKTGRAQRKKINEMVQQNNMTGKLRDSDKHSNRSPVFSSRLNKIKKDINYNENKRQNTTYINQNVISENITSSKNAGSEGTVILQQDDGSKETTILDRDLNADLWAQPVNIEIGVASTSDLNSKQSENIHFKVVKEIMLIHTDEEII
ncbi:MAG: hypothetical protein ACI4RN_06945 [Oscillospiraceae bacterium]